MATLSEKNTHHSTKTTNKDIMNLTEFKCKVFKNNELEKFNFENIELLEPNKIKANKFFEFIPIKYKLSNLITCDKLLVETPYLFCPFGATCFKTDNQPGNYSLSLSVESNGDAVNNIFAHFVKKFDEFILQTIAQRKQILNLLNVKLRNKKTNKKKKEEEIIEDLESHKYSFLLKESPNGASNYPPLLKAKFVKNQKTDEYSTYCLINNQYITFTDENIELIFKKCLTLKAVLHFSHIWIVNGRFGVCVKLLETKIQLSQKFVPSLQNQNNDENENYNLFSGNMICENEKKMNESKKNKLQEKENKQKPEPEIEQESGSDHDETKEQNQHQNQDENNDMDEESEEEYEEEDIE